MANMVPYKLQPRKMGEGRIRIDTSLKTSGEIYTLFFVSQLKIEHITSQLCLLSGELVNEEGEVES
jgi:hypothetical protein